MQTDITLPRIDGHAHHPQPGVRSEAEVRRLSREAADQCERQCDEEEVAHEVQDQALAFGGNWHLQRPFAGIFDHKIHLGKIHFARKCPPPGQKDILPEKDLWKMPFVSTHWFNLAQNSIALGWHYRIVV
jgi:hypothetical protein